MPPATTSRLRSSSYSQPTNRSSDQHLSRRRPSKEIDPHFLDGSSPIVDENLQEELGKQTAHLGNPFDGSQDWSTRGLIMRDASGDEDIERLYQRATGTLRSTDEQMLESVATVPETQEPGADTHARKYSWESEEDFSTRLQQVL